MRYDFSQDTANEMLEEADKTIQDKEGLISDLFTELATLRAELAAKDTRIAELEKILKDFEWVLGGYPEPKHRYCSDCGNDEISGHSSECRIAAALEARKVGE